MARSRVLTTIEKFCNKGIRVLLKIIDVNNLIARILIYSAIKIKANGPLPYSILNPDTSSDSPSAKSKGVRFVSAKLVINHRINDGIIIKAIHDFIFMFIILKFSVITEYRLAKRINDILTS